MLLPLLLLPLLMCAANSGSVLPVSAAHSATAWCYEPAQCETVQQNNVAWCQGKQYGLKGGAVPAETIHSSYLTSCCRPFSCCCCCPGRRRRPAAAAAAGSATPAPPVSTATASLPSAPPSAAISSLPPALCRLVDKLVLVLVLVLVLLLLLLLLPDMGVLGSKPLLPH